MKNILLLGAGRSATSLIHYLLDQASRYGWRVIVADMDLRLAERKVASHTHGQAVKLNVRNVPKRRELVKHADVVISLLPVQFHFLVVKDCLHFKKHLMTASYLSKEMIGLDAEARDLQIMMMGELGLDPGLDHMSAMRLTEKLKGTGHKITSFRSYTGGLISPESIDNPWKYKFTWNPWKVVTAGKGTAQYLFNGQYKYIPDNRLFLQTQSLTVEGAGELEAYINRDSLLYRDSYGLQDASTFIRFTLRYPGYCRAWHTFVHLGWTDDSYPILDIGRFTYAQLIESYLAAVPEGETSGTLEHRFASFLGVDEQGPEMEKLRWLGIFSQTPINLKIGSPAEMLLDLLLTKWELKKDDRDLVVMHHAIESERQGKRTKVTSSLVIKGDDSENTAMAKLVGLPLGIFVKLLMMGKIESRGVHIPVIGEFYEPVLKELEDYGVSFVESEESLP